VEKQSLKDIGYIWIEERYPDSTENPGRDIKAIMKNGEARNIFLNMQNPEESKLVRSKINLWLTKMSGKQRLKNQGKNCLTGL